MRLILFWLAVVTATIGGGLAATPGVSSAGQPYHYDPELRSWAQQTLAHAGEGSDYGPGRVPYAVYVRCYTTGLAFDNAYYGVTGESAHEPDGSTVMGFYSGSGGVVYLRPLVCSQAHRFIYGTITERTANAFSIVVHEAIHRQGIDDEHATQKYALGAMYAAGTLVDGEQLGSFDPADDVGWNAFYAAVKADHDWASGVYHVATSEALGAIHRTWADDYGY